MKGKTKRKLTADFKLKVILEVLKEKDTLATISRRHELHGTGHPALPDFGLEKTVFRIGNDLLLDTTGKAAPSSTEPDVALLYEQIDRIQM